MKEKRGAICNNIAELSVPGRRYYIMAALSAIIATFGLLSNSSAVVIGAMLVAPLMGPIFGIALGISTGDNTLLRKAVVAELAGAALVVGLAGLFGMIPLRPDFANEILARTHPTTYDIVIALASGLAGAYAILDEKMSAALPGVAMATALVPPLATLGLCLAAGQWQLASGAFLLFLANLVAIEFAATVVFSAAGVAELSIVQNERIPGLIKRFGLSVVILTIMTVFMTQTLVQAIGEQTFGKQLRTALNQQLAQMAGARLSDVLYEKTADELKVVAVVLTPQEFSPERVGLMEKRLEKDLDLHCELIIRSLISKDADQNGPVFISEEELLRRKQVARENEYMNRLSKALSEELNVIPGVQLVDILRNGEGENQIITATVRAPDPITPRQVRELEDKLKPLLSTNARLLVRSVITKEADDERFLYEKTEEAQLLEGPDVELLQKLEEVLTAELEKNVKGAVLNEVQFRRDEEGLFVFAVTRTPFTISPRTVKKIERRLQTDVEPDLRLIVRSIVAGDVSADDYVVFDEKVLNNAKDREE
ncbi:conserved hypothetical protein [Syntrophothermus lipocalidus DSM 12680]|uniref:Hydrophobic domain protein n=2 Tax=Syntrophothermus TaxID=129001 RepID=D7CL28_SYNLT|nr:conserved hypothetical protein [Syntrophothermus lipocalidus DSM 12680]